MGTDRTLARTSRPAQLTQPQGACGATALSGVGRTSRPVRRILSRTRRLPGCATGAAIHLGLPSPAGSSGLPADSGGQPSNACAGRCLATPALLALLRVGFTEPSRSPGMLVGSYPTVSPLPGVSPPGGLFSVALSRGSPRVAVNNHPALWSPDVPRQQGTCPPLTRPPGRLVRPRINRTQPTITAARQARGTPRVAAALG
jgi:hypothetical protein